MPPVDLSLLGKQTKMMFLLFNLLQDARPRVSLFVVIGAALVFIIGLSLVVYFYRRYKRIEKEPDDEWDTLRGSLFANALPSEKSEQAGDIAAPAQAEVTIAVQAEPAAGATREFATPAEPPVNRDDLATQSAPPAVESRPTELLASPATQAPELELTLERHALEEDVWTGLEIEERPPSEAANEPQRTARVEGPSPREPFLPPRIERIEHREPYEPPAIEPLTPREQAATRALHSVKPGEVEPTRGKTVVFGSASGETPARTEPSRHDTRELVAERIATTAPAVEPTIAGGLARASTRAPAGSILGLPTEASDRPLILGAPVRPENETGIGGLTHYGEDLGPKAGRAGTIVLLVVLVLLGGAVASYFLVPSVHTRVSDLIARIRGTDAQGALQSSKPKAQIIPSLRPEVNKNMVTARGAVDNISDQPLDNLEIEVMLQHRGGVPPETRRIPVTPSPLPAGERGSFEFEYDGKRDTGFAGYKITKLFSNGNEVKFKAPDQK